MTQQFKGRYKKSNTDRLKEKNNRKQNITKEYTNYLTRSEEKYFA